MCVARSSWPEVDGPAWRAVVFVGAAAGADGEGAGDAVWLRWRSGFFLVSGRDPKGFLALNDPLRRGEGVVQGAVATSQTCFSG